MKNTKKTLKCTVKEKLLSENWFSDEKEATTWVMMGKVLADEQLIYSINEKIPVTSTIRVKNYYKKTYVNKGGLKLEHALKNLQFLLNLKSFWTVAHQRVDLQIVGFKTVRL